MNYLVPNFEEEAKLAQSATRDGFGEGLADAGQGNKRIIGLTADLNESTRMEAFSKACPERYYEAGISEQNMMGIATGFALAGKVPFLTSYAVFSPGRNWDQLRMACYSEANIKVIGSHSGLEVGEDGATHQGMEDIAITRVLPNIVVLAPCDANEAAAATRTIAEWQGPVYMRLTRPKSPVFIEADEPFVIGKAQHIMNGKDVTVIACGPVAYEAIQAAITVRKKKIYCDVILSPSIKPLDEATIVASAKKTGAVVSVEDHQITGGLGGAVAECLAEQAPTIMERVGMPDKFGESGTPGELLAKYNLDRHGIARAIERIAQRKNHAG